jgi:dTDP-glucose 4,6-dehydratase
MTQKKISIMKILVTGGLGFIGSNFILEILKKYPSYKITNVDAKLPGSNVDNLKDIKKNKKYQFIQGNITNKKLVEKEISKSDIVFNFAAESHVDRSISSPESFIQSNIIGTFNILESIRKLDKKLIHISTDEVFGSLKKDSARETDRFNPSSPYSSSKASAELLVMSYVKTYGIKAIITRCTNNFGPRQHAEKLIPRIILFAQKNKKIPIYGSGKAVRDWIFVKDHCNAIIKVSLKGKWGESYNISANNEINNLVIVKKILKILGKPSNMFIHTEDRPGHDFRYSLDSSKTRKELRWKTEYNFEEALRLTVKWYLENKYIWKNLPHSALKNTPWHIKK